MFYQAIKNRLTNGVPYSAQRACERIEALANNLDISQGQADELRALAEKYGSADLPSQQERIAALEEAMELLLSGVTEVSGDE